MANTLKFGNGEWYGKKDTILAYNDENSNYKPLPFNFSRASSATVVNKDGLIETVGSGQPRIDYKDDSKGALLLEPSRSNILPYSNKFINTGWQYYRGTIIANATISPDGTLNASRYQEDSQTGSHLFRRQSLSITNLLPYTGSIFVKKGELSVVRLASNSTSRWDAGAEFNLENGTVTSGTGVIEDYGNGWYRCSISGNAVETTTVAGFEIYTSVGAGRDGQGLFMYGAMFEQGSYATSYIPTQGGVVTRLAETCSQTAPDGVIGQTELTVFYQGIVNVESGSDGHAIALSQSVNAAGTSRVLLYRNNSDNNMYVFIQNSTGQFDTPLSVGTPSSENDKYAIILKDSILKVYFNGQKVIDKTNGTFPLMQYLYLNEWSNQNAQKNRVKNVKLYNKVLSDSEAIALTQV